MSVRSSGVLRTAGVLAAAATVLYLVNSGSSVRRWLSGVWSNPLDGVSDAELEAIARAMIEETYDILVEVAITAKKVKASLEPRGVELTKDKLASMILSRGFAAQLDETRAAVLVKRGSEFSLGAFDDELSRRKSPAVQEMVSVASDMLETALDGELPVLPFVKVSLDKERTMSIFKQTLAAKQEALELLLARSPELRPSMDIQPDLSDLILATCKEAEADVLKKHQASFDSAEDLALVFRNALATHSRDENFNLEKNSLSNAHTESLLSLLSQEPAAPSDWLDCQREHPLVKKHNGPLTDNPTVVPLPLEAVEVTTRLAFQQYLSRVSKPHILVMLPKPGAASDTLQALALKALNGFLATRDTSRFHVCVVSESVLMEEATDTKFACLAPLLGRLTTLAEALACPAPGSCLPAFAVMASGQLVFVSRDLTEAGRRLEQRLEQQDSR